MVTMNNPFATLAMATAILGGGFDGGPLPVFRKTDDEFFDARRVAPELEDLDFRKEAELIRAKKSRLSASNRRFVLRVVDRADRRKEAFDSLA